MNPTRLSKLGLFVLTLLATLGVAAATATAQGVGLTNKSDQPVIIEADDSVEWRQNERIYLAKGNATAKRGDMTLRADTLKAEYRQGENNRIEITNVIAEGNVKITTTKETITGQRGVYNVETGVFTLTGANLAITTDNAKVTAHDRLEYRSKEKIAVVTGNALVVQGDKKIRADRFIAYLHDSKPAANPAADKKDAGQTQMNLIQAPDGAKSQVKRIDAIGNVVITTANEVARGEKAIYDGDTGIARLIGNVKLTRGDNQLNGDEAEVNMKTGVSRLLASKTATGERKRVTGMFFPRSGEKTEGEDDLFNLQAPGQKKDPVKTPATKATTTKPAPVKPQPGVKPTEKSQ